MISDMYVPSIEFWRFLSYEYLLNGVNYAPTLEPLEEPIIDCKF